MSTLKLVLNIFGNNIFVLFKNSLKIEKYLFFYCTQGVQKRQEDQNQFAIGKQLKNGRHLKLFTTKKMEKLIYYLLMAIL